MSNTRQRSDAVKKTKAKAGVAEAAKEITMDVMDAMDRANAVCFQLLAFDAFLRFQKLPEYLEADDVGKVDFEGRVLINVDTVPEMAHWFNAIPSKGETLTSWDSGFVTNPSKSGYKPFLDFTATEFADENLRFYTACRVLETFVKENEDDQPFTKYDEYMYLVKFIEIAETFILDGAKYMINIGYPLRQSLTELHLEAALVLWENKQKFVSSTAPPEIVQVMTKAEDTAGKLLRRNEDDFVLNCFKANCGNLRGLQNESARYKQKFNQIFEDFIKNHALDGLLADTTLDDIKTFHADHFKKHANKKAKKLVDSDGKVLVAGKGKKKTKK